jgi:hypothetical protein
MAMKIENFEKKIHGTVKILGWSKLLADSKNEHVLYVWRSNLTGER